MQSVPYVGTMTAVKEYQLRFAYTNTVTPLTEVHEATNDVLDIAKERYDLTVRDRKSYYLFRPSPCNDKLSFFSTQPVGVGWKVGDQEVGSNADDDCRYSFEYENPSPAAVAADTLHVGDSTGK